VTTVSDLLAWARRQMPQREGLPNPGREARWLLGQAWGVREETLWTHPERVVPGPVAEVFRQWVERRRSGTPAHHLVGRCTFWGHEIEVSPEVLVPRPETELAVETALGLPMPANARVLDVGTGSGCIALSLAASRPRWRVFAVDRSLAALEVARRNLACAAPAVPLLVGDLTTAFSPPWDLVIANLPYVPTTELAKLAPEVAHDPVTALDGGADGLVVIRRLIEDLHRLLRPCGGVVLEIGENQVDAVATVARRNRLAVARRIRDVGGVDRVLVLQSS
jgi:release factor glutamine methyltransferase